MKKMIGGIVLLVLLLAGVLGFQIHERETQKDLYAEATVFFQEKDYKKAIQFFAEARSHGNLFSGSMRTDLAYYEAEAYLKLEEYKEAIEIYDEIIGDVKKSSMAYMMKAYCLTCLEEYDQALSVYQEGYEKTKDGEFLYCLANLYVTTKDYDQALKIIEENRKGTEDWRKKLSFLEIVVYEKQLDYATAYEKATAYCQEYPEDEKGIKEREFLNSRR